jgi:hypothetical protein
MRHPILFLTPLMVPALLGAQAPKEVPLGRPTASLGMEFSLIRGVRELSDGSLLVVDPIDAVLRRVDAGLTRVDTLGRRGAGPNEYKQPDAIWPEPGDSSLLVDLGNNRLAWMDRNGRFSQTDPIVSPGGGGGPGTLSISLIEGVDAAGHLYYRGSGRGDSVGLFRRDRQTGKLEQVARLKAEETKTTESGSANSRQQSTVPVPLSPRDGWAVAPDGTIFIARAGDYHLDVLGPDGAVRRGAPVPYRPVAIDAAEKKAWVEERNQQGGLGIQAESRNGVMSFSISRGRQQQDDEMPNLPWPAVKPPFAADGMVVDGQGRVWVRREQQAATPALYDVFDRQGRLVGSVRFPAGRRLIGSGRSALYVARTDDSDLQYLERYALPF